MQYRERILGLELDSGSARWFRVSLGCQRGCRRAQRLRVFLNVSRMNFSIRKGRIFKQRAQEWNVGRHAGNAKFRQGAFSFAGGSGQIALADMHDHLGQERIKFETRSIA